jgi:hypothetical protein
VPCDAIANFAEAREVNKKALLEKGWDGGVQIGRLRELPQFVDDEGGIRSGSKKIWNKTEARGDLAFERFLGGVFAGRPNP